MKVAITLKDDGVTPGTLQGQVAIDFDINLEKALSVIKILLASTLPGDIASALSAQDQKQD